MLRLTAPPSTDLVPTKTTLVGDRVMLANTLRTQRALGLLLTSPSAIKSTPVRDGLFAVTVVILAAAPRLTRRAKLRKHLAAHRNWTRLGVGLAVLVAAAGAIVGLGYLAAWLFSSAIEAVASVGPHALGVVAIVLAALWLLRSISTGHACRGIHCPDCPSR